MSDGYYDQSYPPSLWEPPPVVSATGATAGVPGSWTPTGSTPPASVSVLQTSDPPVVASPTTAWTVGQYVQTGTAGGAGQASWNGTAWVAGPVPVEEPPAEFTATAVDDSDVPPDEGGA